MTPGRGIRLALGNPGTERFWPYGPMARLYRPYGPEGHERLS
jgi:hypothetical protein